MTTQVHIEPEPGAAIDNTPILPDHETRPIAQSRNLNRTPKIETVLDSWEDDPSDTEAGSALPPNSAITAELRAPPPTPISAYETSGAQHKYPIGSSLSDNMTALSPRQAGNSNIRPDKSTAVAGRLIAGALGIRAPKRSDEEKEYEKAIREKEKRRQEREREKGKKEIEEVEKARRSVWED